MKEVKIYQVGGSVRDELLGIKSNDIDYAVEALSFEEMRDYLLAHEYKIFLETPEYFTIRAKFPKNHPLSSPGSDVVDFTLCRVEGEYSDARHPDQVTISNLMGDLSRRDFTVNAIAKGLNGEYIDPFNGQEDLKKSLLRCVGDAKKRLQEDALRSLRAIRFTITKGFKMDSDLEKALHSDWLPPLLHKISVDRIRQELNKALSYDTIATLRLLNTFSDQFMEAIFRDGLWLQPSKKARKLVF